MSTCYKLLERLVLHCVSPEVEKLLSPAQAGFRRNRSTCEQVAALTTRIENGFQELFLRDRRFKVHIGDDTSAWRTQVNGLPQGVGAITNTLQPLHQ